MPAQASASSIRVSNSSRRLCAARQFGRLERENRKSARSPQPDQFAARAESAVRRIVHFVGFEFTAANEPETVSPRGVASLRRGPGTRSLISFSICGQVFH
jgi:hypothetical protein